MPNADLTPKEIGPAKDLGPIFELPGEQFGSLRNARDAAHHISRNIAAIGQLIVYAEINESEDCWQEIGATMALLGEINDWLTGLEYVVSEAA